MHGGKKCATVAFANSRRIGEVRREVHVPRQLLFCTFVCDPSRSRESLELDPNFVAILRRPRHRHVLGLPNFKVVETVID